MNSIQALAAPVMAAGTTDLVQWLGHKVSAGFPSPADDFSVSRVDLDRILEIKSDTFFMRVAGRSMESYGIANNDIVAIRKGRRPVNGDIVVMEMEREFLVKMLEIREGTMTLKAGNPDFKDIVLKEEHEAKCWGVVTATIKVFPSGVVHVRPG